MCNTHLQVAANSLSKTLLLSHSLVSGGKKLVRKNLFFIISLCAAPIHKQEMIIISKTHFAFILTISGG